MPATEVELIAESLNTAIAAINANMLAFAMLTIFISIIMVGVVIWSNSRITTKLVDSNRANETSSNAAILELASAVASSAQYQQTQAQGVAHQITMLSDLPGKLAEVIRQPISDLRGHIAPILGRLDELDRKQDQRMDTFEAEIRTAVDDMKHKPDDLTPVLDLLGEYRRQDTDEHKAISESLDQIIVLLQPPPLTEPDDITPSAASKTPPNVLNVDAAAHEATVQANVEDPAA